MISGALRVSTVLLLGVTALLGGSACEPTPEATDRADVLSHLPRHEAQRQALCARGRDDAVTAVFCRDGAPTITSLVQLQRLLDLDFDDGVRPDFALTATSSSLSARHVSAINPRAVIFRFADQRVDNAVVAMGYARGDHTVELAVTPAGGQQAGVIHFYLLRYEQPCAAADDGCSFADRFTDATEAGWSNWSLYDDVDLGNSTLDCLHCHQPEGPGTRAIFRMQELPNPWTHWLAGFTDGGRTLYQDYRGAHGGNGTAGIPGSIVGGGSPISVDNLIKETLSQEIDGEVVPVFESRTIEAELLDTPGRSDTWKILYDEAVAGAIIPPPFREIETTDPAKLTALSQAYVDFEAGRRQDLPDVTDVFSAAAVVGSSFLPAPGLDAPTLFKHACAQCHNGKLDQSLTRARFNAFDIDNLTAEQTQTLIDRLTLPANHRDHMPPTAQRDLRPEDLQTLLDFLTR